ncbi:MAG: nucleotidyltransferase domain-containing protein [Gammaproteobacteria bacterium]|nr:nucleotidyltransferase domain-containing protein [Gammaproteobacteria bacterium]MDH5803310.1 nucleotidyltransferase domain-containing protein [Gammaproteobacteria bacterium]
MTNEQISDALNALEQQHNIKILYACESGSRAWGFPSPDSDYDVRFIYAHPVDWYLSVFPGKDTIDIPISGDSDLGGWDLRKSFGLLKKSNCALMEWLSSPIVYRENDTAIAPLKDAVSPSFLTISACHHYLSMAQRKFSDIVSDETVKLKSYFYALRAVLCALYIIDNQSPPPMEISKLKDTYISSDLLPRYEELLSQKMASVESHRTQREPWLDSFLEQSLVFIEQHIPDKQNKLETAVLDRAFRTALRTTWGE